MTTSISPAVRRAPLSWNLPRTERWTLSRAYLVIGGLLIVLAEGLPVPRAVTDATYSLVGAAMVVAILLGVRRYRPRTPGAWYLMALGQTLWVIADSSYNFQVDVLHGTTFPTISDFFYLMGYPAFAGALLVLVRRRLGGASDHGSMLDSATVTVSVGLLSWVLIARPTIDNLHHSPLAAAVAVAYPAMDIVLLGGLVRLLSSPGGSSPAFRYLMLAVGLLITGDTVSASLDLFTTNRVAAVEALWQLSYVAWGAAALHPSMRRLAEPGGSGAIRMRGIRLAALLMALLITPAILVLQQLTDVTVDIWVVIAGSAGLSMLVMIRMNLSIVQVAAANDTLEALQDELALQASHDSLTGLVNRSQTMRLLAGALGRSRRNGRELGVLFVDLDGFKDVNDSHGHRSGDEVLRQVTERMLTQLRDGDFLGRLGGDEFIVGVEDLPDTEAAVALGIRLIAAASQPVQLSSGLSVQVGASVGVSLGRGGETDVETLLHEADLAVYEAKQAGRGRVQVYGGQAPSEQQRRDELETAIGDAISNDELVVHYQPLIELDSRKVTGYEALVRWERPGVGLLPPSQFLPVAESSDLICDLDTWVLNAAVDQLRVWNEQRGDRDLRVAVNVSGRHVSRERIVKDITDVLRAGTIDPSQLVVEVTETAMLDDCAAEHLERLRQSGVVISLDDYGTGYASSAQLARLPIDVLKIDRVFMDTDTEAGRSLLELMVRTAHRYGASVVTEGVTCEEHAAYALSLGCEYGQGYYLGPPGPARVLEPVSP